MPHLLTESIFCTSLEGICAGNSWQWRFEVHLRCDLTLQLMFACDFISLMFLFGGHLPCSLSCLKQFFSLLLYLHGA